MMLYRCDGCAHTLFPARLLCPRCGSPAWTPVPCADGVVTAVTMLQEIVLAELRTPEDVRIIARLPRKTAPGTAVTLDVTEDGALWGMPDAGAHVVDRNA